MDTSKREIEHEIKLVHEVSGSGRRCCERRDIEVEEKRWIEVLRVWIFALGEIRSHWEEIKAFATGCTYPHVERYCLLSHDPELFLVTLVTVGTHYGCST